MLDSMVAWFDKTIEFEWDDSQERLKFCKYGVWNCT